jgi:transcriptional regulator with XRE-family HTH domain
VNQPAHQVNQPGLSAADQRRQALGEFIRSRRARTSPEMVGMPPTLRRRTPGLRREEVALLAGIGVTWYTWLEQGRPINVSAQVLGSIARVLRLDVTEQAHLFTLAELTDPAAVPRPAAVGGAVQSILDRLDPYPAAVVGPHWEILAGNVGYRALVGDYRALDCRYRNTMLIFFTDPRWRHLLADWSDNAPRLVAKMRTAMAADVADPGWQLLVDLLHEHSPEFRELWQRHDVAPIDNMRKVMHHEDVGTLHTEVVHTWLAGERATRLTVYTPMDEATGQAFQRLASAPARPIRIPALPAGPEVELLPAA